MYINRSGWGTIGQKKKIMPNIPSLIGGYVQVNALLSILGCAFRKRFYGLMDEFQEYPRITDHASLCFPSAMYIIQWGEFHSRVHLPTNTPSS